jgi:hypothetical protein
MIGKFDGIPGNKLATLIKFIHSDENKLNLPGTEGTGKTRVVRIKAISPSHQDNDTDYAITLQILDWLPGRKRVDQKYLLQVYEIFGEHCLSNSEVGP